MACENIPNLIRMIVFEKEKKKKKVLTSFEFICTNKIITESFG